MKIICEKENLLKAINTVLKSGMKNTEGVLIETISDDEVKFTTNNSELGIECTIECEDIEDKGKTFVNAIMFSEIIKKLPNVSITLELQETFLKIKCKGSQYKLSLMNVEDFIPLPTFDVENTVEIKQKDLKNIITKIAFAASTEDNRPVFTGCLLEVSEQKLNAVAVDGFRLALKICSIPTNTSSFSAIIPAKSLSEIAKILLDADSNVKIGTSKNQALFKIGNSKIVTRILEGEFLNYNNTIPSKAETTIIVDRNALYGCFERISLISTGEIKDKKYPTKVSIKEKKMVISCNNQLGDAKEEIPITLEGKELEIGFNSRYFLDILKAIDNEQIKINFGSALSPCVIEPIEKEDFKYMILPLRLAA